MTNLYILQGKTPVLEPDLQKWWRWCKTANKIIQMDRVDTNETVTTFFLSHDKGMQEGCPLLFETSVRGGHMNGLCCRYSTWDEAEANHEWIVHLVMG